MKAICLSLISIILICGETVSSYSSVAGSEIQWSLISDHKLAILGTLIVWSLPRAIGASKQTRRKTQSDDDDGDNPTSSQVILIRKATQKLQRNYNNEKVQNPNHQQKKDAKQSPELDPLKCFPKALCGVSSEVAQISKRRKNGLITEYLVLMKAIARHPEMVEEVILGKHKKSSTKNGLEQDIQEDDDTSDSEEDDEDNESDEDEENDEEETNIRQKSKKKQKEQIPKNDEDFYKLFVKEKIEMDNLYKDTYNKEALEQETSWWDSENTNQNKPNNWWSAPQSSYYENYEPFSTGSRPYYRGEPIPPEPPGDLLSTGQEESTGAGGGITSFVYKLLGFGKKGDTTLADDPWFQSAARDLSGEVVPGVAIDETREILETAIEIGKTFDQPSQCNSIFTACKYDYTEMLYMIDDLRRSFIQRAKDDKSKKGSKKTKTKSRTTITKNGKAKRNKKSKNQQTKKKHSRRPSLTSDGSSGNTPADPERWVIPVQPYSKHPEKTSTAFSLSNVFSWLG